MNNWDTIQQKNYYTGLDLNNWLVVADEKARENLQLITQLQKNLVVNQDLLSQATKDPVKDQLKQSINDDQQILTKYQQENEFIQEQLIRLLDQSFFNDKTLTNDMIQELTQTLTINEDKIRNLQADLSQSINALGTNPINSSITPAQSYLPDYLTKNRTKLITASSSLEPLLDQALTTNNYAGYQQLLSDLEADPYDKQIDLNWTRAIIHYYLSQWDTIEDSQSLPTSDKSLTKENVDLKARLVTMQAKSQRYLNQWHDLNDDFNKRIDREVLANKKKYEEKLKKLDKKLTKQEGRVKDLEQQLTNEKSTNQLLTQQLTKCQADYQQAQVELALVRKQKEELRDDFDRINNHRLRLLDEAKELEVENEGLRQRIIKLNGLNTDLVIRNDKLETRLENLGINSNSSSSQGSGASSPLSLSRPGSAQSHHSVTSQQSDHSHHSSPSQHSNQSHQSVKSQSPANAPVSSQSNLQAQVQIPPKN